MLLRRSNAALWLLSLFLLLALPGPAPLADAAGAPVRVIARGLTAEPLHPSAFEPSITAPPAFEPSIGALAYQGQPQTPPWAGAADLAVDIPHMPGIMAVERVLPAPAGGDGEWELAVLYPDGQPRDFTIAVPDELEAERGEARALTITLDGRDVPVGEARTATILLTGGVDESSGQSHGDHAGEWKGRLLRIVVRFVRAQSVVLVESSCEPRPLRRGDQASCTVTLTNTGTADAELALLTKLPRQLRLVHDSVTGGRGVGRDRVIYRGTLPGRKAAGVSAVVDPGAAPVGYVPLRLLGIAPIGDAGDETLTNVSVPAFSFGGVSYTRLGVASNGYLVLGGGSAEEITAVNTALPDPARPNGVLAPFWSDLDPSAGGAIRVASVSDGAARWLVVDYDRVPNRSQPSEVNSFQVWIGLDAPDTISFVYGPALTAGDRGLLTIGAESADGSAGATIYHNGVGEAPAPSAPFGSFAVGLRATPGGASTYTLRFNAIGHHRGAFVGYTLVRSSAFAGITVSRFAGEVLREPEGE